MKSLTPVIIIDEIEPVLAWWEALGFENTGQVMEGEKIGFVMLKCGNVQVMYQTRGSIRNDVPALADTPYGGNLLFIQVDDLDAVQEKLGRTPLVIPRRRTFYGADELVVREPGGNVVTFAQFAEGSD